MVELHDCVPTLPDWHKEGWPWLICKDAKSSAIWHVPPAADSLERAFGDYAPGRYAWLLSDVRALPEPLPARGMPGLWQPDAQTEAAIAEQIRAVAV